MELSQLVQTIAIYAIPVLLAITLHEAAHGYVARHFGDLTAYAQGRVSLNPVRHIDLVGTIIVPAMILVLSKFAGGAGLLFGWAKPVPVNYSALRRPRQHMIWVAAAGPGANLVMAICWAALFKLVSELPANYFSLPMLQMGRAGIQVNVILMLLNLLPILPLDGGRIVAGLLPRRIASRYARLEPWGFPVLLLLLFTSALGMILAPMISFSYRVIGTMFQI
ncbi:MAG: site-2 protease family protein [Proteobacteria bacterium]|nr:site-2 protease family protein [Pseudomonadota bacterium]